MSDFKLVIGSKHYSSWSLRPWLLLKYFEIPFEEELIRFDVPEIRARIKAEMPAGWVPALWHAGKPIWDSLGICEYLADVFPEKNMWPTDTYARGVARSAVAEMHSGFGALRNEMPMEFAFDGVKVDASEQCLADISRIQALWAECRETHGKGGDFLFGDFSVADAFYAPVVSRFRTYGVNRSDLVESYMNTIWNLPTMQEWLEASKVEPKYDGS